MTLYGGKGVFESCERVAPGRPELLLWHAVRDILQECVDAVWKCRAKIGDAGLGHDRRRRLAQFQVLGLRGILWIR